MGLFSPGWKKNYDKAKKAIAESESPKELYRIAAETALSGTQRMLVQSQAVDRLCRYRNTPEGREALLRLAREGQTPVLRCHAAYNSDTDEGRAIMADTIAAAYAEPGLSLLQAPERWIAELGIDDQRRVYDGVTDKAFKKKLARNITDPDTLVKHLLTEREQDVIYAAWRNLKGTQEQYLLLARQASSPDVKTRAIGALDLSAEDGLCQLAEAGNETAQKRLTELDAAKYVKRYPAQADRKLFIQAIGQGAFSQQELEDVAMNAEHLDKLSPAWAAMQAITEPERLERLLMEHSVPTARSTDWFPWASALLEKLKDRESVMVRYILSDHDGHAPSLETIALRYVHSPDALRRIAMQQNGAAPEAAQRLGDKEAETLTQSKHKKVAEWAVGRLAELRTDKVGEKEALQILRWTLDHDKSRERFERALRQVGTQEGLMKALVMLEDRYKPFGEESAEPTYRVLLERITDGAKFTDWCLGRCGRVSEQAVKRLHELISGTAKEDELIERAKKTFMAGNWNGARLMGLYSGLSAPQAVWKYGGADFIKKQIEQIESSKEKRDAEKAVASLSRLYREVKESRDVLSPYNGRKYTKHDDYEDANCGSNSYDRDVPVIVDLTK